MTVQAVKHSMPWVSRCATWIRAEAERNRDSERFHCQDRHIVYESHIVPEMSYPSYIKCVNKAVSCYGLPETTTIWAMAFVLLRRFVVKHPTLLNLRTAHRLIITSFVVAMKGCSDQVLTNSVLARCGGVCMSNLNDMEKMFLTDMNFQVCVCRDALEECQGKAWCVLSELPDAEVASPLTPPHSPDAWLGASLTCESEASTDADSLNSSGSRQASNPAAEKLKRTHSPPPSLRRIRNVCAGRDSQ
eukprot:Rhum_TRINITY_DN9790_c0_g1::Rhum_TRINITY_DN9790_c0_g1_i1::g.35241::m.35241